MRLKIAVLIAILAAGLAAGSLSAREPGRFAKILTADEASDFALMGIDPQADFDLRVAAVCSAAKAKRFSDALSRLTTEELKAAVEASDRARSR